MKESILRILTNHKQSTLDGLRQITGGDKTELSIAVEKLIEDGVLVQSRATWNGIDWIVYKLKKKDL